MTEPPTPSVAHLHVESFLQWMTVERGRAMNTVISYRRDLVRYEDFLVSKKKTILTVEEQDIETFVKVMQASGESVASTARRIAAIRMLHSYLTSEDLRSDNPTARL